MIVNDRRIALHFANRPRRVFRNAASTITRKWQTSSSSFFAGLLFLITTLLVVAYYMNHPQPPLDPDSLEYLATAQRIATHGQLVDPHRLPGFPLLIVLVFALTGQGNVLAVSVANAVLFIGASLEIYVITLLVFRRRWLAFVIGLLVGTNLVLLSFVKSIGTEGLALWLVVSLAFAAVLFVQTLRIRYLWLVAACTLGLSLTRAEWIYLPVPLFAYLLLVAARRSRPRSGLLLHALACVVLLYAVLAGYIFINATQYHFVGVTDIQNINALGKVIQYDMQNEAPAEYASIAQITNTYRSHGGDNPYDILRQHPELNSNHFALVGAYAQSIIERHPGEFLLKSVPVALFPWRHFYYESSADPQGPFGGLLVGLQPVFHMLYRLNIGFPLCATVWIFLLCWRRTACLPLVQAVGVLVLLVLYGIVVVTLGGYGSYTRLETPFDPLLILVLWGSLLVGLLLVLRREHKSWQGYLYDVLAEGEG
jgi:hypothetical protein